MLNMNKRRESLITYSLHKLVHDRFIEQIYLHQYKAVLKTCWALEGKQIILYNIACYLTQNLHGANNKTIKA